LKGGKASAPVLDQRAQQVGSMVSPPGA